MTVFTDILKAIAGKALGYWKLTLAGMAMVAALFYRWRSNVNAGKALRAQHRIRYLEAKEVRQVRVEQKMEAVAEKHKKEREELEQRRREGKRGGGLGKW